MRVLVGYASAHNSTKGIANEIRDRLMNAGLGADVRSIDEIDTLETYDAVVLGSAIHNQAWLPQAAAFAKAHADDLARRPVWLFSVSSVGETSSFLGSKTTSFIRRRRKDTKSSLTSGGLFDLEITATLPAPSNEAIGTSLGTSSSGHSAAHMATIATGGTSTPGRMASHDSCRRPMKRKDAPNTGANVFIGCELSRHLPQYLGPHPAGESFTEAGERNARGVQR
jgi:flavodoxin